MSASTEGRSPRRWVLTGAALAIPLVWLLCLWAANRIYVAHGGSDVCFSAGFIPDALLEVPLAASALGLTASIFMMVHKRFRTRRAVWLLLGAISIPVILFVRALIPIH